jgi:hypothetical protein
VILTAAHCLEDDSGRNLAAERLRFLLGSRRRSSGGERINAVRAVEHPRWDETQTHDVALVKLERPASLGGPIALAGPADAPRWAPGRPATIIGWGATAFLVGPTTDELHEAQVTIRSDDECATFNPALQPETEICAGERFGGRDSCQGDSGGPLMVPGGTGGPVLVGVVSYGVGCAFPTQYGVYAEAAGAVLRPWIEQTASSLSSAPAPATGGGGTGDGATAGQQAAPPTSATALPGRHAPRARVALPARLGSARRARRTRRLAVTVRTNVPLRGLRVSLRRGRSTFVALGTRRSLQSSRGRVILRPRRGLRAGRAVLTLTARDQAGRRVVVRRTVRVAR